MSAPAMDWIRIAGDTPRRWHAKARALTYEIRERPDARFDIFRDDRFLVTTVMLYMAIEHAELDAAHLRVA